jgi:RNA polymerase sigma-70 factor (TIGR02943 family)
MEASSLLNPEKWVELYADGLYTYARWKVKDEETAQDLVQETFLSALKSSSGFRGESSEKTWLKAILKNKILDHYRKHYQQAKQESISEETDSLAYWFAEDGHWKKEHRPENWKNTDVDPIESKEFYRVLSSCRDKLSPKQQLLFTAKYLDDRDSNDISKELDLSSSNYWVILHRMRVQIRECLENNWF